MTKKYYIGLDMGTDSVGWAVTDPDYNLLKDRGKDYWGAYLFDPAQTAAKRRGFRSSRRRISRVRQRLNLLQELLGPEVEKVDENFFIRLNNSKFFLEDKDPALKTKSILFADNNFSDKSYFKKYKTIFHLRHAMATEPIFDIRLLYLAIHHIIKNRGHFLFENQNFSVNGPEQAKACFEAIDAYFADKDEDEGRLVNFDIQNQEELFDILCDRSKKKSEKEKQIALYFSPAEGNEKSGKKVVNALKKAFVGSEFSLNDLFLADGEFDDVKKLGFSSSSYEDNLEKIDGILGDDRLKLIEALKAVYDLSVLNEILHGKKTLSEAKIETYEIHKDHLKRLKQYVRDNFDQSTYKRVFSYIEPKPSNKKNDSEEASDGDNNTKKKIANYAAYTGKDKQKRNERCTKEEFYKFLKNDIGVKDEYILEEIEKGTFMPKQISGDNSVIPYQLNLAELNDILSNAEKYFPYLTKKDSDGLTISDKIRKIMTYRVPYYVGPLTNKSKNSWLVKKAGFEDCRITPWNFDAVVDKDMCEEEFINRMKKKCTYLRGEDVLPASSFLYSEFAFLNELNNLSIKGERIDSSVKSKIYEYAHECRKPTLKKCCDMLIQNGILEKGTKPDIFSGIDGDFKNSLSSYIDFKNILGEKADLYPEMCEDIILRITLISDKTRLAGYIKREYGNLISDEEIKKLKSLNYTKWGRLSKAFLSETYEVDGDGVQGDVSIIERMREETKNLNELLSSSYGYKFAVELKNAQAMASQDDDGKITYKTVENLYCSPSVKRSIWRTICLVKEIVKVKGQAPEKIFVEMTREVKDPKKKGKRTVSRKQQIVDLYNSLENEKSDWIEHVKPIGEIENENLFNSDKVVLYYRQMGRDVYTGKPIDFDELFNTKKYDIDHIYPQSKIKDDSLDNRVLVDTVFNQHVKGDRYPLPEDVRRDRRALWEILRKKGFISEEKFHRLTRTTPITVQECQDFINRQIVETSQSTKAAADLLRKLYPKTKVVYSKAGNADTFKKVIGLVKVRELNDLHHAKDAYVNIVCGNIYNTKFGSDAGRYFKEHGVDSYNLKYIYDRPVVGAWKPEDKARILGIAKRNSCRIVRFTSQGKGQLFDGTIYPAGKNDKLVPLKGKAGNPLLDTAKYGGYDSAKIAGFMLVRSDGKKGKKMLTLECVTILAKQQIRSAADAVSYCEKQLGLKNPEVLVDNIKLNTLLNINGSYAYLRGKSNKQIILCNANELLLDDESVNYLKLVSNHFKSVEKLHNPNLPASDKITVDGNLRLYDVFRNKLNADSYKGLAVSGQVKVLDAGRKKFEELSKEDQLKVLWEILKFMQCNSVSGDVTKIGGAKTAGVNLTSKDMTNSKVKMILQSPTGHYKKIIDFSEL